MPTAAEKTHVHYDWLLHYEVMLRERTHHMMLSRERHRSYHSKHKVEFVIDVYSNHLFTDCVTWKRVSVSVTIQLN